MNKDKIKYTRKFLGFPLENLSHKMSTFDKKHLKSYLKGKIQFSFGRDYKNESIWHEVKQELKIIENGEINI